MEINSHFKASQLPQRMLCIIILFLVALSSEGCEGWYIEFSTPVVHPAPCLINELLLDVSAFPGGSWQEMGSPSERDAPVRMGIERIGTNFSGPIGGVFQEIYRFEDEQMARRAYKDSAASWFTPSEHETDWATPPELDNLAVNADQVQAGCNDEKSGGVEQCQYVARYGPYILRLFGGMRGLSDEDFIKLVAEIDLRATNCLARK